MSAPVVDPPRLARSPRVDAVPRRHQVRLLVVLLALVVLGGVASLAIGSRPLSPARCSTSCSTTTAPRPRPSCTRCAPAHRAAIAVGAALGVAGALMQGHTRNPLADPGLLGVEAGASCAVVIGIFAFGVEDVSGYAWFALAGAGLAAAAVFAIGSTRRGPDPVSLVLAGAAVSAFLGAVTPRSSSATPTRSTPTGSGWSARWPAATCRCSGRSCRSSCSACSSPRPARPGSTSSSSATTSPPRWACTRGARRRWASPP